jgi:hypothetical protein
MSRRIIPMLALLGIVACGERPGATEPLLLPVFTHGAGASDNASGGNFGAPMSSAEEPTPENVTDSRARGNVLFRLSADGESMSYQLSVANIENVTMAHIHRGPVGVNGPVVVWLYPSTAAGPPNPPGGGRIQGVIAQGTITTDELRGSLAGQPLSALVDLIISGEAYVNVHTVDGVNPPNSGPGNFPGGEVRGQIRHRGH